MLGAGNPTAAATAVSPECLSNRDRDRLNVDLYEKVSRASTQSVWGAKQQFVLLTMAGCCGHRQCGWLRVGAPPLQKLLLSNVLQPPTAADQLSEY